MTDPTPAGPPPLPTPNLPTIPAGTDQGPSLYGGGDQNGTQNGYLKGQAGTGADRLSVPRQLRGSGNYTGIV